MCGRDAGEGGGSESAEKRVSGQGEVERVHGIDAEEFADEESATFAMKGVDVEGFAESGEEGCEGALVEADLMWMRFGGRGFRTEDMDVAARGMEKRVVVVEVAVAGDEAAEGLVVASWDAEGHAVGEPGAAADEECIRAVPEVEEAVVVEGGCPAGGARGDIGDFAIGGEGEVEGDAGDHGGIRGCGVKRGLLFAVGG